MGKTDSLEDLFTIEVSPHRLYNSKILILCFKQFKCFYEYIILHFESLPELSFKNPNDN